MTQPEGFEDLDTVEEVKVVQDNAADYVVILNQATTNEVLAHYLKNLLWEWEWTECHLSEKHGNGWVQFTRKAE